MRPAHPWAWWGWALGAAGAASLGTNPLLNLLIAACVALWSIGISAVSCRAVMRPAACTRIMYGTGRTAAALTCQTWCCCALFIIGLITAARSPSLGPLNG